MKNAVILSALLIAFSVIHEVKAQNQDSSQVQGAKDSTNSVNSEANSKLNFAISEKPDQKYTLIGPKVKGLSIGMRFQDAIEIIKEKIKGKKDILGNQIELKGPFPTSESADSKSTSAYVDIRCGIFGGKIRTDNDNAVCLIILPSDIFESTSEISSEEFAKKFMEAYAIPEFKPVDDCKNYEYTDPSGVKIKIFGDDKTVIIERVASEKKIKASFD